MTASDITPNPTPPSEAAAGIATDTVAQLTGAAAHLHVQQARTQRAKAVLATQGCEALLLGAAQAAELGCGGDAQEASRTHFTLAERLALAQQVAADSGVPSLAGHYGQQLAQHLAASQPAQSASTQGDSSRWQAMRHFAQLLATQPAAADRAALLALPEAGLPTVDVVLLAQLVGFVSYQARVVAGVQALVELGAAESTTSSVADGLAADADAAFVHPANLPAPGEPLRLGGYTSETLDWKAWLPVVNPAQASAAQLAVLDASHPKARSSDFYLTLAHQPRVLQERSNAFNAIMYAPGGLSRAEREVATTVVSRINRCVYCASVHAQRFEQLAKRNDVIAQIFADPDSAGTNARERALVQASAVLTRNPAAFGAPQLAALRAQGLGDVALLDAIHAIALFAWANRLMLNLGEAVWPK